MEDHAWQVGAKQSFSNDLFGSIAEILIQMLRRKSRNIGLEREDGVLLNYILTSEAMK